MRQEERRYQRLVETLAGKRRLLIVIHDHPDPDALAGALLLRHIAQRACDLPADIAHGGLIGRAENRAMVRALRIPLSHFRDVKLERYDAVALVDTQPQTGNNSLPADRMPDIVFDHHPQRRTTREVQFSDVRDHYGAVATILYEYLQAAGLEPDRRIATAVFYAIRSETQNLGRESTPADARAFGALFPVTDNRLLARIEHAPFSREYLVILASAFRATRTYGSLAIACLERIPYPDVPAQLADLLLRVDDIHWVLVMGVHRRRIYLSIRTLDPEGNAGRSLQCIVGELGRAGGHGMIAGGRVDLQVVGRKAGPVQRELARRARKVLGVPGRRGRALLARQA